MSFSLTARLVFPIARPPLPGGVVVVEGDRLAAVLPHGTHRADFDLGEVALLPGFVNAHVHLDLTGMAGLAPPSSDFTGWLREVIAHRRQRSAEEVRADIARGIQSCLRSGTTLVGDISGDGGSFPLLAASPLRAVVFRELLGLSPQRAAMAEDGFGKWLASLPVSETCRPGIGPHAPYSVRIDLYSFATRQGLPLATHLAETEAELELLQDRTGPFVPFLRDLGVWDEAGLAASAEEVSALCASAPRLLLAHANYLPALASFPTNATIVYCPRTHAAFGHPPHPFLDWLERGARVALGTDGLASNPDLDLLAEARWLYRQRPETGGARLLRAMTLSGAEALGFQTQTGSLEPGKSADLIAVPLGEGADEYQRLFGGSPASRVMVGGQWVV